jgi:hypothetical protein
MIRPNFELLQQSTMPLSSAERQHAIRIVNTLRKEALKQLEVAVLRAPPEKSAQLMFDESREVLSNPKQWLGPMEYKYILDALGVSSLIALPATGGDRKTIPGSTSVAVVVLIDKISDYTYPASNGGTGELVVLYTDSGMVSPEHPDIKVGGHYERAEPLTSIDVKTRASLLKLATLESQRTEAERSRSKVHSLQYPTQHTGSPNHPNNPHNSNNPF